MNPGLDFTVGDIIEEKEPTKYRKGTTFKVTVIDQQHYAYIIRLQTKGPSSILPGEAYTMQVRHGKAVPVRSSYHTLELNVDYSIHFDLAHKWKKVGENPGNPEPYSELQFKVSLARAEQFMNELRRLGFDVGHDADYQDPTNFMTVIVRDVPAGRRRLLVDTANRYATLLKQNNPGNPGSSFADCFRAIQKIYPGVERERLKHYLSLGDWERRNIVYMYGGISKETHPAAMHNDIDEANRVCEAYNPGNPGPGDPQQPNCPQCGVPMSWKVNLFVCPQCQGHYDVSVLQKAGISAIPPTEKTVHGYNYRVRIWYPNAPENSTEGMMLAAYDEDLAKEIQRQYPGVTYEVISKDPVLGDPQQPKIPERQFKFRIEWWAEPVGHFIGTIRTVPENYYVASIRVDKSLEFQGLEAMTRDIDQNMVRQWFQGQTKRKWAPSQVWGACKQAGIPVEERDVIVKHYLETGELPFQTWPSLRLIESWPEQPGE